MINKGIMTNHTLMVDVMVAWLVEHSAVLKADRTGASDVMTAVVKAELSVVVKVGMMDASLVVVRVDVKVGC